MAGTGVELTMLVDPLLLCVEEIVTVWPVLAVELIVVESELSRVDPPCLARGSRGGRCCAFSGFPEVDGEADDASDVTPVPADTISPYGVAPVAEAMALLWLLRSWPTREFEAVPLPGMSVGITVGRAATALVGTPGELESEYNGLKRDIEGEEEARGPNSGEGG